MRNADSVIASSRPRDFSSAVMDDYFPATPHLSVASFLSWPAVRQSTALAEAAAQHLRLGRVIHLAEGHVGSLRVEAALSILGSGRPVADEAVLASDLARRCCRAF